MPAVAPYRPVSPVGTTQFPFESAPPGQLLSMRPPSMGDAAASFVDRTSSDPTLARRGRAVDAAQSVARERQPSPGERYVQARLKELGPAPPAPAFDIPSAPGEVSFGEWSDQNYPEYAGKMAPTWMIAKGYQEYLAWQSARAKAYDAKLTRSAQQMRGAEITDRANRRPTRGAIIKEFRDLRGPVPTSREAMDTMLERDAYGKGGLPALQDRRKQVRPPAKGPTGDRIKKRFLELIDAGNAEGARKLVDTWHGRGVLDDMTIVRSLAPAVRRIQEAVSMMGQEPSEDEQKMIALHRDAITRLGAQRQQTGPGAPPPPGMRSPFRDVVKPVPAGASSPFEGMGGGQPTMDTGTRQRLIEAFRRGELTRDELNKFLPFTGYEPSAAP